jgi:hypothetical protein
MKLSKSLTRVMILVLGLFVLGFQPVSTGEAAEKIVPSSDAKTVALAWMKSKPDFLGPDGELNFTPADHMLEIKEWERNRTIAYVLVLEPKGFIIVSPSYDLNPIIGFSNHSNFDLSESPTNILLDLLRSDISERLAALDKGFLLSSYRFDAQRLWSGYLEQMEDSGRVKNLEEISVPPWDVSHGPFLSSVWGQSTDGDGYPTFNYFTPPGPDGASGNYVSGCVATALGQIFNYYEWPITGTGSHSYIWDNGDDPAQTLSANFGSTTYSWANILDDYTGGRTTLIQRQAAGLVTYHAGVAVNMNYSSGGSGASISIIEDALENYFRFSGEYVPNNGTFYTRLYDSMLAHRPAELGISGNYGGHAVVVDGVRHYNSGDTTQYYHLNMGWNGYSDAWYDIASGFTTGSASWTTVHGAVLDIVPNPDVIDPGETVENATFPVSWNVSPKQGSCLYELQQLFIPETVGSFSDGAENGSEHWDIRGYWETSDYFHHDGNYAFKGHTYKNANWYYPGTMTLARTLKITPSTNISYYWGAYYGQNLEMRLEISTDGVSWETLKSYTVSSNSLTWSQENVTTMELSGYFGELVQLRFVIDYLGGLVYTMSTVGFYVDAFSVGEASMGSWETLDDSIPSTSRSVTVSQNGDYSFRVRANCSKWYDWSDVESIYVSGLSNPIYIPLILR